MTNGRERVVSPDARAKETVTIVEALDSSRIFLQTADSPRGKKKEREMKRRKEIKRHSTCTRILLNSRQINIITLLNFFYYIFYIIEICQIVIIHRNKL